MKKIPIYVLLTAYLLITIFPFLWIAVTSFKADSEVLAPTVPGQFTPVWDNYRALINDPIFIRRLVNSLFISLAAAAITVPIGSLAGYAFARFQLRGKDNWFFMLLTTRMAPPVAFGVPFYLLTVRLNLIDRHAGLIAIYVFMSLAFCIWLIRGFFEEVPIEIEESAYVDGCTRFAAFLRITLPMARAGIVTTAVLIFIMTWNEFFFASILTRSTAATYTVHLTTYFGSRRIEWGRLSAASTVVGTVPLIFAVLTRKYLVRGFSLGAVRQSK